MATTYFDRYGNYQGEIPSLPGEILPYIVEEAGGGVTYICYFPDTGSGVGVKRITEVGTEGATTTTIEHAFGAWSDRATLTYYPINQAIPEEN
jgi:hypothetical protein